MKAKEVKTFPKEVISLDGHTVILRYAEQPAPGVLDSIQKTLFNQKIAPTKGPNFCKNTDDVR